MLLHDTSTVCFNHIRRLPLQKAKGCRRLLAGPQTRACCGVDAGCQLKQPDSALPAGAVRGPNSSGDPGRPLDSTYTTTNDDESKRQQARAGRATGRRVVGQTHAC